MYGSHDTEQWVLRIVAKAMDQRRNLKGGYVTSYDPNTYSVRLRLEPESSLNEANGGKPVETQWLPMFRGFGGDSWGIVSPPNADPNPPYGDYALALWLENGPHGVALVGFANDVDKQDVVPPLLENGEYSFRSKGGTFFKVASSGAITVTTAAGVSITVSDVGAIEIQGAGGAKLNISESAPAGTGSIAADDLALVTKQDLQYAVDQLIVRIKNSCQAGNTANPSNLPVRASTTIKGTD